MDGSRRALLQAMFYGMGVTYLAACGGGGSSGGERPPSDGDDLGEDPASPEPTPEELARELPLSGGPLAGIGELMDSGVDGILIPAGFAIRRVAVSGTPVMGDLLGCWWHRAPDGGAVFPVTSDGGWVYVSNCEDTNVGGVGALRFDREGKLIDAYRILDDTRRNCAGGATPWGTWLSCEEIEDGQVYECDPLGAPGQAEVKPALGRLHHEAAAVDMPTRTVFMTEDRGDGRLYRFVSAGMATALNGQQGLDLHNGVLQVLEVAGFENGGYLEDLEDARRVHRVHWVDVIEPVQPQSEVRQRIVEGTGQGAPGTTFKGGEGIWIHNLPVDQQPPVAGVERPLRAVAFFASKGDNRVYALDIDNDLIEVVFDNESGQLDGGPDQAPFDDVDNVVVSPMGDVIVAEDGDAMRLMVVVPNRPSKILVKVPGKRSELTGPAFTPDGGRLYFSSQRGPTDGIVRGIGVTYELTIPDAFREVE